MRERAPREPDRVDRRAQVARDERQVGRLDRDVGARADRDPEIGLRERRRVVDAVADHRDDLARLPAGADLGHLLSGMTSASTRSIPTSAATRRPSPRPSPVSSTGVSPSAFSSLIASRARRLDRVARPSASRARSPSQVGDPPFARPTSTATALDDAARRRLPGDVAEPGRPRQRPDLGRAPRGDRPRDRMLGRSFDGAREPQDLRARGTVQRADADQPHPALGDRAGLVEHDRRRRAASARAPRAP